MKQHGFEGLNPRYYQIMQYIKNEYKNQPPGTQIPSEKEWMERFQVSRGTVQRAIMELCKEGFLHRIQGKGTFVAERRIQRQGSALLSFTEEIKGHGFSTTARILKFEIVKPPADAGAALGLGPDDMAYHIERIRYIEDEPMAIVLSYIPYKIAPTLTLEDVDYSVYDALKRLGWEPVRARDTFRARIVDDYARMQLECDEGDPVFETQRIAYAEDDTPVEYAAGVIKGQNYALVIEPHSNKRDHKAYFHYDQETE